jgi:hypothetical protein
MFCRDNGFGITSYHSTPGHRNQTTVPKIKLGVVNININKNIRHRSAASCAVEIVGSNLTGGMDVCLLRVLCVLTYRSLR